MFTSQEVTLDLGFGVAQARLLDLVAGDWLIIASRDAFAEGHGAVAGAEPGALPGGVPAVARLAGVRYLPPEPSDRVAVVPLRWEAAGPADDLFPVLDADIMLRPAGECARLVLSGSYRPPEGWFGAAVDRRLMEDVTATMLGALLRKLAQELCRPGSQRPAQRRRGGGHRTG